VINNFMIAHTHTLTPWEIEFTSKADLENSIKSPKNVGLHSCRSKQICPWIPMEFRPCLPLKLTSTFSQQNY